ncbi:MAG TPA: cell division FtsA domain-containing protein, partial [Spirochaetota bacterium]|nr:cell division FtsA domain-containing protein [Spirochaetota bacterium]
VGKQRPSVKVSRKMIARIIEPRMEEIFNMVKNAINSAGVMEKVAAGVVLTGGACQSEGTVELAEKVLDQPVRIGRPLGVSGLSDKLKSPIYATSVGLALFKNNMENDYRPQGTAGREGTGNILKKIIDFFKELFS